MKTNVRKPNPPKEPSPSLGGKARHVERPLFSIYYEGLHKYDEMRRHRELSQSVLLAFGAKPNDAPGKIDLAGDVHVSFGETATLLPRDFVANGHPLWLAVQCRKDNGVFVVRDAWLWQRKEATNAELVTRIAAGKIVMNGLLGNKTQQLYLQEGSVLPRSIKSIVGSLSPSYVGPNMLAGKCAGYADIILSQERAKVAPSSLITFQRILLGCVALLQKLRHPGIPSFLIAGAVAFGFSHLAAEVASAACVKCHAYLKSSAFASAFALQVQETNPPKGAIAPLV